MARPPTRHEPVADSYLQEKKPKPAPAGDLPALEERTCECGCGKKFKVLPSSPTKYATRRCNPSDPENPKKILRKAFNIPEKESS